MKEPKGNLGGGQPPAPPPSGGSEVRPKPAMKVNPKLLGRSIVGGGAGSKS
ncbi:MAG: hypothetical protein ACRDIU_02365 [Actinomycetota bacterium]